MKSLVLAFAFVLSSPAFAMLMCDTEKPNPVYAVTIENNNFMTVQDSDGRQFSGVASYADSYSDDMLFSYYLPLSFTRGFWLVIREGFLPNWQLCVNEQTCYQCFPTR
jgi:hypothetical protein